MKYIVNKTAEIIRNSAPAPDGEAMIRVDGFEDIRFYNNLALKITKDFDNTNLSVDIKLANNKWNSFLSDTSMTTYQQSLKQHGWIAENESITRYRNLHKSNLLVLMGTETEEDKGGLSNCFCVTADTLITNINGKYSEVFTYLSDFSDSEKDTINKLYNDLFAYVPVDIFKLSNIADSWEKQISNVGDFIDLFFANLNDWGLPIRRYNLPTGKELRSKKNILEPEYKFISRSMFKRMTGRQYESYQEKFDKYIEDNGEYGPDWEGWTAQGINSFKRYSDVILEYARGENVSQNRKLLEETDFDITASILEIKLPKTESRRTTNIKLKGNPLPVFTKALMYTLIGCKEENIARITFDIRQADIVSVYSETEGNEEKEQLLSTWKTICRHTNGIIDMLNQGSWKVNDSDIEISLTPEDVFSPKNAMVNIDQGIVKAANSNKTIHKIEFMVKCYTEDNTFISKVYNGIVI